MACHSMFSVENARELLQGRFICFFGDSNTRGLYKDLLWLLEDGRLISDNMLKVKNEESFANDTRLSNGELHNGRDYQEIREYKTSVHVSYEFITRLCLPDFVERIQCLEDQPDVLVLNSCVWDLTRWGADGVQQFKDNIQETFTFLKSYLPYTRIIWLTTLPPTFHCRGGFLTEEVDFMRNMLPWHILCANKHASDLAVFLKVDVIDLHYYFRFLLHYHVKDGIHWDPIAMRFATNLLLTHLALNWNYGLPNHEVLQKFHLNDYWIRKGQQDVQNARILGCRVPSGQHDAPWLNIHQVFNSQRIVQNVYQILNGQQHAENSNRHLLNVDQIFNSQQHANAYGMQNLAASRNAWRRPQTNCYRDRNVNNASFQTDIFPNMFYFG